jgi:hypothetical protein
LHRLLFSHIHFATGCVTSNCAAFAAISPAFIPSSDQRPVLYGFLWLLIRGQNTIAADNEPLEGMPFPAIGSDFPGKEGQVNDILDI